MQYEEEVWRPSRHISGYDNGGPLTSGPAPYRHHTEGAGNPRAQRASSVKVQFKTGTLTAFGKRIVEACEVGIDERSLIEKLNGLSAYADFQRNISKLVEAGYLLQIDGRYTRAK